MYLWACFEYISYKKKGGKKKKRNLYWLSPVSVCVSIVENDFGSFYVGPFSHLFIKLILNTSKWVEKILSVFFEWRYYNFESRTSLIILSFDKSFQYFFLGLRYDQFVELIHFQYQSKIIYISESGPFSFLRLPFSLAI